MSNDADLAALKKEAHAAIASLEKAWQSRVAAEHELMSAQLTLAKLRVSASSTAADLHKALDSEMRPCW